MNTSTTSSVPAIVKELTLEAPAERAFRVFTANMGAWWPKEHHIGKSPLKDCVVEPQVGGRWYELAEDGTTCQWGKVLVWDPPWRVVLAWQLNAEFAYDPNLVTEVEVRFTAVSATRTEVHFEHRHLDRFGPKALPVRGEMDKGWGGILQGFQKIAQAPG